jgi:hypothetical protein
MRVYTTRQGLGNFIPALWGFLHRRESFSTIVGVCDVEQSFLRSESRIIEGKSSQRFTGYLS